MKRLLLLALVVMAALVVPLAAQANPPQQTQPSMTQTQYYPDGSYAVGTVVPDSTNPSSVTFSTSGSNTITANMTTSTYYCGDVGYNHYVYLYNVFGWNMWTYKQHFAVHVCGDTVRYKVALWDEPVNTAFGWGWCGNIVNNFNNLGYEAKSYTKGCFYAIVQGLTSSRYPWITQTIGGNGGLWATNWGIG
jgi:hypothetical protein